jgi:serine/threonine-protein kinase HipA
MSELLPIQRAGECPHDRRVTVFLSGLLAEGNLREHQAFDAGVTSDDVFGLIAACGRDTAGALVFMPGEASPDRVGSWAATTDAAIARRLQAAGRDAGDGLESNSLAGVQPKIVLRRDGGRWLRCLGGAPSTHIVKLGHAHDSPIADIIDTEAASTELARSIGLSTVHAHVATFARVRALVVSRYDRAVADDGTIGRLHQEDAAQALGLDVSDLNRKFQRGKALPSLKAIAAVLRNGGAEPDRLLALTTLNLALGNSDAHAKNISVLRHADGGAELAPAYDVSMHAHHASFSDTFAMDVRGQRRMSAITGPDLVAEGESWPLPRVRARRAVRETLEQLEQALVVIDRDHHPGVPENAWQIVRSRTHALLRSLP